MTTSSPTRTKCPVKGCPGFVDFTTNGNGKHVERCDCCEARKEFERQNMPRVAPKPCRICKGPVPPPTPGKRHRAKLYCEACAPVASRVSVARKKAGLPKLNPSPNGAGRLAGSAR